MGYRGHEKLTPRQGYPQKQRRKKEEGKKGNLTNLEEWHRTHKFQLHNCKSPLLLITLARQVLQTFFPHCLYPAVRHTFVNTQVVIVIIVDKMSFKTAVVPYR